MKFKEYIEESLNEGKKKLIYSFDKSDKKTNIDIMRKVLKKLGVKAKVEKHYPDMETDDEEFVEFDVDAKHRQEVETAIMNSPAKGVYQSGKGGF